MFPLEKIILLKDMFISDNTSVGCHVFIDRFTKLNSKVRVLMHLLGKKFMSEITSKIYGNSKIRLYDNKATHEHDPKLYNK